MESLTQLGMVKSDLGELMEARRLLERAVALEPTNPYALRALGQIHLMRDDPASALPHLRLAADQPPPDPITLYTLAQTLMALAGPGQLDEAEACLNQAQALGPPRRPG